jgi:hypothetical protein
MEKAKAFALNLFTAVRFILFIPIAIIGAILCDLPIIAIQAVLWFVLVGVLGLDL